MKVSDIALDVRNMNVCVCVYMCMVIKVDVTLCCPAGETDWKILAIDVTDPLAGKLNGET